MALGAGVASFEVLVARRIATELDDGLGEPDWSRSKWKVWGSIEIVLGRCTSSVILPERWRDLSTITLLQRLEADTVWMRHAWCEAL